MVKDVNALMADINTGEIFYKSRKRVQFFAGTGGEKYIRNVIDSLFRGVRKGYDLSLTIELRDLSSLEPDLFSCNVHS